MWCQHMQRYLSTHIHSKNNTWPIIPKAKLEEICEICGPDSEEMINLLCKKF